MLKPKVQHFGFYPRLNNGLEVIAGKNFSIHPETTLISGGWLRGVKNMQPDNSLYCFSYNLDDEVAVTIYETLSGRGGVFIVKRDVGGYMARIHEFFDSRPNDGQHYYTATITGCDALSFNPAGKQVHAVLIQHGVKNIIWTTWSWLPNKWSWCGGTAYIVRLNLTTGNVRTFTTGIQEVKAVMSRSGFDMFSEKRQNTTTLAWLKNWFSQHPLLIHSEKRVLEMVKNKPECCFSMSTLRGRKDIFLFVCSKIPYTQNNIKAVMADEQSEYILVRPEIESEMPMARAPEVAATPAMQFDVATKTESSIARQRGKKRAAVRAEPVQIASKSGEKPHYTVEESEFFQQQLVLLSFHPNKESLVGKIDAVREDLREGRLPTKSVEKFYVAALSGLSESRGRGAWRLLITRNGETLTLHSIVNYHDKTWKRWC